MSEKREGKREGGQNKGKLASKEMEGKREQYKGSERIRKEGKDLQGRNIKESREAVWCLMGKKKI